MQGSSSPALPGLLARWNGTDLQAVPQAYADRLSGWLDWTHAVSLAAALGSSEFSASSTSTAASALATLERDCVRLRTQQAKGIEADAAAVLAERMPAAAGDTPLDTAADYAPLRRRHMARQHSMEDAIVPLRARARALLAGRSPALARLAEVDSVMERVLGARERLLLAAPPALLERRFEALRRQADPEAWRAPSARDLREALLAELDLRMQPIEGLLEALRPA